MELAKDALVVMLRKMLAIRYFEQSILRLFEQDQVRGATHVYLGEEAVAVGVCTALRPDDYVSSTHRGHGHCIAKGGDLNKMMAELLGKATGYCKGKGGSMHIADLDLGILGANGIVGSGIPIAVGAALGSTIKGEDRVAAAFFGDGASNTGAFHEGINLAAVWKLPVVFVCENNMYAVSTSTRESLAIDGVVKRAAAYGIPGVQVDGNDLFQVYEAARDAVARAREGKGPTLLECLTYRWTGHTVGDPGLYRCKEEVEAWKQKDPILRFRDYLIKEGILTQEECDAIDREEKARMEQAVAFAQESPEPLVEDLLEDLYA
ncbi:MAG: thiamine pyrophosphate-dependent dehydrogenase E1 component subunit alpha [Limnochordia bacterium]|jgi:pyruvate dehydrogenase E1 component alpha subunit|nr:thiamine pyrophosphate-dependent dehydrogenase E1 component subunit alpha [Bacillota bacterium]